jgi:dTDP-4-amino-4,6-dideoxygalactose transaminase
MSAPARVYPASLGGAAVRPDGPPPWPPADPDVQAALAAATSSDAWGLYHGEHVRGLEADLGVFQRVPHVLTCASGTLAVEAALRALGVSPGDEVVLAAYEYESNLLTVHALGATPVLIDIHPGNWQLDPANLEAAITPRTRAVICSHLHGGIVPMRAVSEIAQRHNLGVVEDAAQATGATVESRPAGTWGDAGVLSFGGSKLLSAGRGGALLFRDAQLHQRAKVWLQRGLQQWAPLSELQAAALRPQLRKLPEMTRRRAENVRSLLASLTVPGLVPFTSTVTDSAPAYYKLGFQYDPAAFGLSRDRFISALRAEGIAVDSGFKALHVGRSPSRFRAVGGLPQATAAHERCFVLHHPILSLSQADMRQVAEAVAKTYRFRDALAERFKSDGG